MATLEGPPAPQKTGNAQVDDYLSRLYQWAYKLWYHTTTGGEALGLGSLATQMIADGAVTTPKVADNAISYLATVAGFTVNVTTHGTVANPTTLVVVAKAVIDGIDGTTSMELRLDGVAQDTSTDIYGGLFEPQSALTTQFMETITDSTSHTISFAVYAAYVGDGVINILEVRR